MYKVGLTVTHLMRNVMCGKLHHCECTAVFWFTSVNFGDDGHPVEVDNLSPYKEHTRRMWLQPKAQSNDVTAQWRNANEVGRGGQIVSIRFFHLLIYNLLFNNSLILFLPRCPSKVTGVCAMDVCNALGYENGRKAVADHVDSDDVTKRYIVDSAGRKNQFTFVNESGIYSLIFGNCLYITILHTHKICKPPLYIETIYL